MKVKFWWELCALREEFDGKTPDPAEFTADIWKVKTGKAIPVYQQQDIFFDRTYASPDLKKLIRIVLRQLCGLSGGNATVRTQVAYGGGKSHSMLTLYHLCTLRSDLKYNPTVKAFLEFSGIEQPPKTRVAILPFDKFDVHNGLTVYDPDNNEKTVYTPWGALAYQLGGDALFSKIRRHEETGISYAQPLMEEILSFPQKSGYSTLVIIDEASIFGRSLFTVGKFGPFKDFFQYLTQAASSLEKVAVVATLLHTGMERADAVGQQVLKELTIVFDRVGPVTIEPITQADVAEILRKRLFREIPSEDERRKIANMVSASWQLIPNLSHTEKDKYIEDRIFNSYPFHPDFIEILYSRWIELPKFQRTRGALQLLSIVLRDGRNFDPSILIGPSCLLGINEKAYSAGLTTLVDWTDDGPTWSGIIQHELNLAQRIQSSKTTLKNREIEQLVLCVFLLSQPEGRKGQINDILRIIVHPNLQEISALKSSIDEWRTQSWYFDDTLGEQEFALIKKKNLISIHDSIINSLTADQIIEMQHLMETEIGKINWVPDSKKHLIKLHCLTRNSESIEDSIGIHLGIYEPKAIAILDQKHVPDEINDIFKHSTLSGQARIYQNGLLIVCPDSQKLSVLREKCCSAIAWEILKKSTDFKKFSKELQTKVNEFLKSDRQSISELIRGTYSVVYLYMPSEKVENRPIRPTATISPYEQIVEVLRQEDRILDELKPEKILPKSGLNLWALDSKSLSISFLVKAFYRFPRLPFPEDLNLVYNAIAYLIQDGKVVLRILRPDGSYKTVWREKPEIGQLSTDNAELILMKDAEICEIPDELVVPGSKISLWPTSTMEVNYSYLLGKFDNKTAPKLESESVLENKIKKLSKEGKLCVMRENVAYCRDPFIDPLNLSSSIITSPPPALKQIEIMNESFQSSYWKEDNANFSELIEGIATVRGYRIPNKYVLDVLSGLINTSKIEIISTDLPWPPENYENLAKYTFKIKKSITTTKKIPDSKLPPVKSGKDGKEETPGKFNDQDERKFETSTIQLEFEPSIAEISDVGEFAEKINALADITWTLKLQISGTAETIPEGLIDKINQLLQKFWPDKKFIKI